jgi:uncharacterized protein (DUF1778 family)
VGRKNRQLQIRVTAAEKVRIQRAAAGARLDMSEWVLRRLFAPAAERVRELVSAPPGDRAAVRYVLAELNDLLTDLDARGFAEAVVESAPVIEDPWFANYVAAMIETAAALKMVRPPAWTDAIEPLRTPFFGSELASLRLHLLLAAPPAFRRRNLFVDASIGDRI